MAALESSATDKASLEHAVDPSEGGNRKVGGNGRCAGQFGGILLARSSHILDSSFSRRFEACSDDKRELAGVRIRDAALAIIRREYPDVSHSVEAKPAMSKQLEEALRGLDWASYQADRRGLVYENWTDAH